jgi:hypothetical protein
MGEGGAAQFNWVTSEGDRRMAMLRHVSAPLKRLLSRLTMTAVSYERRIMTGRSLIRLRRR